MSEEFKEEMQGDNNITEDDKLWAGLSLAIPIIGIIALLMEEKKDRPFIRHAAVNGVALAVTIFVLTFILGLIPIVQCITAPIGLLFWIYGIYLGWQAYSAEEWANIPVVTDFCKEQGWI